MNQIVAQKITAPVEPVNHQLMVNYIEQHLYIYWSVNLAQNGIHYDFVDCLFDNWKERGILDISKESFTELVISEYFFIAGTGNVTGFLLGEPPEIPRADFDFPENNLPY